MTQRHKHADLIIAWANGAEIQWRIPTAGRLHNAWHDCSKTPEWREELEYRIKPQPKPDVVRYQNVYITQGYDNLNTCKKMASGGCLGQVRMVYDGETGKLKDAQVL